MTLKFGAVEGNGVVEVDYQRCAACGTCVKVCKGDQLTIENGRLEVHPDNLFGCIACGHCVAACPQGAIQVHGRGMQAEDMVPIPPKEQRATYDQFYNLALARRSVREFQDREVAPEVVQQIIEAASTAPMGIPPTDVRVLVRNGFKEVHALRDDLLAALRNWIKIFSPFMLTLMRPFMSKDDYNGMKTFVLPAIQAYDTYERQGIDYFMYGAPLAMFFYSQNADQADPFIASTYAMLAGEALGLGTCMLGFPAYAFQYDKKLRARYGIRGKFQPGVMVIFGYPKVRYVKAIRRRFLEVRN
ncbi:MAG TPA: nitroreductase family protein [Anaerolineaceae bacterium]|nr:nitroreductase family protein [Anaerolineaceae bacterium]